MRAIASTRLLPAIARMTGVTSPRLATRVIAMTSLCLAVPAMSSLCLAMPAMTRVQSPGGIR